MVVAENSAKQLAGKRAFPNLFGKVRLLSFAIGCSALFGSCAGPKSQHQDGQDALGRAADWVADVELHNPSKFARRDAAAYFSFYDLGVSAPAQLRVSTGEQPLASESIDSDGDGAADGLLVLLDLAAGETRNIRFSRGEGITPAKRTQAEISVKQGGSWVPRNDGTPYQNYEGGRFVNVPGVSVPEFYTDHSNWIRYEGPGIESDKVGYRIYLDGRNGFDIFGKSIAAPVLQQVGLDGYESYHQPQSWGMDILKVGKSLGAGGFGFWAQDQLVHLQEVGRRSARITQDGYLFSSFQIHYEKWQVAEQVVDIQANLSMQAGSRLVKNQLRLTADLPNLAIGLVAHPGTILITGPTEIPGDSYSYLATWGTQSLDGQKLGMAVFFRHGDREKTLNDGSSHIAVVKPAGRELTYYFAAAWQGELSAGIADEAAFRVYLEQQAEQLTRPLRQRLVTRTSLQAKQSSLSSSAALVWSQKLADAELVRKTLGYHYDGWDVNRKRKPKFEYDIVGLLPMAYDELGEATGNLTYRQVKFQVTATYIAPDGVIRQYNKADFNMDSVAPGRALLRVYAEDPQPRYKVALDTLRAQLREHPKTDNGAFWHKQIYPGQLWLDGVYMGMPFLAEYALKVESAAERERSFEEISREFALTEKILRDPATGLYYHAWDEDRKQVWANPETGLSPHFWARGMGWLGMALVDVLDYMPAERAEDRTALVRMSVDLAKTLQRYQDPSGTWWQIMDKPGALGNYRESSATAMFTYFLAKAVNQGYLTETNFGPGLRDFVLRSYAGLINEFVLVHPDGKISMVNQCYVAGLGYGRDGSYDYYLNESISRNDPKGTVPFILAGIQVAKMLEQHP